MIKIGIISCSEGVSSEENVPHRKLYLLLPMLTVQVGHVD